MKNFNEVEMENVPIRKRKIFQSKKEKYSNELQEYSNEKNKNSPIRKWKIFQSEKIIPNLEWQ
jgi:sugar-specific transcriptional regulator TrmB